MIMKQTDNRLTTQKRPQMSQPQRHIKAIEIDRFRELTYKQIMNISQKLALEALEGADSNIRYGRFDPLDTNIT